MLSLLWVLDSWCLRVAEDSLQVLSELQEEEAVTPAGSLGQQQASRGGNFFFLAVCFLLGVLG